MPHWPLATLMSRAQAAFIDAGVLFLPTLLLSFLVLLARPQLDAVAVIGVTFWLVGLLYLGGLEGRAGGLNGQTLGKRDRGIRTVRLRDGAPISRRRARLRALLSAVVVPGVPATALAVAAVGERASDNAGQSAALLVFAVVALVAMLSPTRRAPHDWLAGTAVVEDRIVGAPPTNPAITGDSPGGAPPMIPLAISQRSICLTHVALTLLAIALSASGVLGG